MSFVKEYWKKIKRQSRFFFLVLISLTVIPVLSGWVGEVSKNYFKGECLTTAELRLFWVGLVGSILLVVFVVWMGKKLLPARVIDQTKDFRKRPVVIALLSPCDNLKLSDNGEWRVLDKKNNDMPHLLSGKTLHELVGNSSGLPLWNWQQTLRAAYYHQSDLKKLVLVGSLKGSGEKQQLDRADKFFSTYFSGKVAIMGSPAQSGGDYDLRWQADFEELDALIELLRDVLRTLHKNMANLSDEDIIIDCTGGYKVASIAAALVTLDRPDLMFQYVGNTGGVLGFNVAGHADVSA